jgi:hypothetical protein
MLAQDTGQPLEIRAPVRSVQRKEWLRGIAQRVRDCQADSPVAHIESENSWRGFGVVLRLASRNLGMGAIILHPFEST